MGIEKVMISLGVFILIATTSSALLGNGNAVVKTFFGFEDNNFDEMNFETENVEIILMPSVNTGENYVLKIPSFEDKTQNVVSMARPHDNDMIFGFYFLTDNSNPNPPLLLFGARDNEEYHFQIVLYNSRLHLLNSEYEVIGISESIINRNRWYRIESRLRKDDLNGEVDVFVNGNIIFSQDGDFDSNGVSGATEMYLGGQVIDTNSISIIPPSPSNIYISSGYYLGGADSNEDIIGNFSVRQGEGLIDLSLV